MKVLALIAARGGSKGLPNKNIKILAGKPLIAHSIEQALACDWIEKVVVTTDSEEIAKIARQYGAEVPFIRPAELAGDTTPILPVLKHAVLFCQKNQGFSPDIVVDLQATSPIRTVEDIRRCVDALVNDPLCDIALTGYRSNVNPYFNMVEVDGEGIAKICKISSAPFMRRQDAPAVHALNGSVYVWRTGTLLRPENVSVMSGRVKFIEMPEERSVDIDSEIDFLLAEAILKRQK